MARGRPVGESERDGKMGELGEVKGSSSPTHFSSSSATISNNRSLNLYNRGRALLFITTGTSTSTSTRLELPN